MVAGHYAASGPAWVGAQAVGPFTLLALIAGLFGLVATLSRPELGVLVLVAVLYTNVSEPVVRAFPIPSPLQLVALATAAAAVARLLPGGRSSRTGILLDPLLVPLALDGFVIFASSLAASDIGRADEALAEHMKGILVFLVITNLTTSRAMLRQTILVLVLAGAFLGSISVYQVLTGSYDQNFAGFGNVKVAEIVVQSREPRVAGPLSDPNFYAQILVALVPLALYRLWDEPSRRRKAVAGYALAVIVLATVFTFSRGGAIALALVVALAIAHRRVGPKFILLGLLAAAPLWLMVPQGFAGRLSTLVQLAPAQTESVVANEDSSFRDRRRLMTVAWRMFSDHPLLGVGAGNYSEHFNEYADHVGMTVSSYEKFGRQRFSHNLYLQVLAETGLAGLLAFAAIVVATMITLWRAYRTFMEAGARRSANVVVSLALALTGYLATSLFLHGTYIRYLWLFVALSAAAGQVARRMASGAKDA